MFYISLNSFNIGYVYFEFYYGFYNSSYAFLDVNNLPFGFVFSDNDTYLPI